MSTKENEPFEAVPKEQIALVQVLDALQSLDGKGQYRILRTAAVFYGIYPGLLDGER